MNIAIIGAGTYGSYAADLLSRKYPDARITIFEVGDASIRNETEIGYRSHIGKSNYSALSKGRYFGFGGASSKWGGQLLTFSENDFSAPSPFLAGVVAANVKHRKTVFGKFNLKTEIPETRISKELFVKTGIWLGYFNRNLFKHFKIGTRKNVEVISNTRVTKLQHEAGKITGLSYVQDGQAKDASFDHYFLTSGAFESNRLLLASGLIEDTKFGFSDHLSQRAFKLRGGTKIGKEDFQFLINGSSLITRRIIGEIDGISFFAHPIYNSDFPFFQNLKKILFQHKFSASTIKSILADIPNVLAFAYSMFVKRRLYVYRGEWYFQIDIENPSDSGKGTLAQDLDAFGQQALSIEFDVDQRTDALFTEAKRRVREYLVANGANFEDFEEPTRTEKYEDTYHPFGMAMSESASLEDYFSRFGNMLVLNTGVLPRAGGINSTAAGFPLLEEYVERGLVARK